MVKEYSRVHRVSEHIHKALAQIVQQEMKDPRVGMVITRSVDVNKDFSFANVHVSFLGIEEQDAINKALAVLQRAAGFLRSRLAQSTRLRSTPQLRFYHDDSSKRGVYLSSLIDRAVGNNKKLVREESNNAP